MKRVLLLVSLVILAVLRCGYKDPTSSLNSELRVQLIFPSASETILKKFGVLPIDRTHLLVQDERGKTLIDQNLQKSGSVFTGSFNLAAGTGYSLSAECYQDSVLIYQGSESNISVKANATTSVQLQLTGVLVDLGLSASSLDFGYVGVDTAVTKTLRISNSGTATLLVSRMSTTNSVFTIASNASFSIEPGGYQDVTIRFAPVSFLMSYNGSLQINNNATENVKEVALSGTGAIGIISLSSSYLSFGTVDINSTSDKTLRISNTGKAILQTSLSTTNDAYTIVGSTRHRIAAGGYQDVTVRFAPTSVKDYLASLAIDNNSEQGYQEVTLIGIGSDATGTTVTDIDGNTYRTVKIGDQWWMAENLKVTHYRNSDAIPNVTDYRIWEVLTTGAYCVYGNNSENIETYGRLYNWHAVNDNRQIAPAGWHVPNSAEWQTLFSLLGDEWYAGGKLKATGTSHWSDPNTGATNETGFSALPGGYRDYLGGFSERGMTAGFWSSTKSLSEFAGIHVMRYDNPNIISRSFYKTDGFSVRCVKD